MLRGWESAVRPLERAFEELCLGNTYVTTLNVIKSCVVKLSVLTKAERVYRGLAGGLLPEAFRTADRFNVRGGVESGFMSTSLDRSVAVSYAASGSVGALFEIQQCAGPALSIPTLTPVAYSAALLWVTAHPCSEVRRTPVLGYGAGSCSHTRFVPCYFEESNGLTRPVVTGARSIVAPASRAFRSTRTRRVTTH